MLSLCQISIFRRHFENPSKFCSEDNEKATVEDLTECAVKMADWAGTSESTRNYMYNFAEKVKITVDRKI